MKMRHRPRVLRDYRLHSLASRAQCSLRAHMASEYAVSLSRMLLRRLAPGIELQPYANC